MLFSTTTQLKDSIGGAVNLSLDLSSLNPTLLNVAELYLLPYLGQTLFDNLAAYVAADYTPTDADLDALLPYARAPLAAIGIAEYSMLGALQFSEAGLFRFESDDKRTPYKYQENAFRSTLNGQGFNALERMILWLEKNKANYSTWVTEARTRCFSLFVSTAAQLRSSYNATVDRQVYEALRPLLEDMENFLILSSIGQAQFDALKTLNLTDPTTLTYQQSEALNRLRKAIALGAIQESLRRNIVQLREGRLIQVEALEPQSYLKEGVPANPALSLSSAHLQEWKERHLSFFLTWIKAYPLVFTQYADYLADIAEAEAAAAEAEAVASSTCGSSAERCLPYVEQEYTPSTGTGIINL